MGKTLVAYFSKTGTTKEAAQAIGKALAAAGREVEVAQASAVASLSGYAALVFGAPINGMRWIPEAEAWTRSRAAQIRAMPHAYFFLSYMFTVCRPAWRRAIRKAVDGASALTGPLSAKVLPGRVQEELPAPFRFLFGIPAGTGRDLRDPAGLEAWAGELDSLLPR